LKKGTTLKTFGRIFAIVCLCLGLALCLLPMTGCAVGFTDDGNAVAGVDLGGGVPGAESTFRAAADFLPPPWNYVAGGVISLLGLGGASASARAAERRSEERARTLAERERAEALRLAEEARQREHAAWDEAQRAANAGRDFADAQYTQGQLESGMAAGGAGSTVVRTRPAGGAA
jgi:hypothetical protein